MESYIRASLKKYGHSLPPKPQHSPHRKCKIRYSSTQKLFLDNDTSPALDICGICRVQAIVGYLLYYRRSVENKLIVALSDIGTQQSKTTESTTVVINQLLDYVATCPNDGITYRARNMRL